MSNFKFHKNQYLLYKKSFIYNYFNPFSISIIQFFININPSIQKNDDPMIRYHLTFSRIPTTYCFINIYSRLGT